MKTLEEKISEDVNELKNEGFLKESAVSRIFQHIEHNTGFAVISAFSNNSESIDKNHQELKAKVRSLGLGFTEIKCGFVKDGKNNKEKSLFIANIKQKNAVKLGCDFNQPCILYKDSNGLYEIGTNETTGIGKVIKEFKNKSIQNDFTYTVIILKKYYSRLLKNVKGMDINNKDVFIEEIEPVSFNRVAYNSHIPLSELDLDTIVITLKKK
jgi:hypothetical protein